MQFYNIEQLNNRIRLIIEVQLNSHQLQCMNLDNCIFEHHSYFQLVCDGEKGNVYVGFVNVGWQGVVCEGVGNI